MWSIKDGNSDFMDGKSHIRGGCHDRPHSQSRHDRSCDNDLLCRIGISLLFLRQEGCPYAPVNPETLSEGSISLEGEALKSLSFFVPTPLLGCTDPGPWSSIGGTNAFPLPRIPAPRSHVGKGTSDLQRTTLRLIR